MINHNTQEVKYQRFFFNFRQMWNFSAYVAFMKATNGQTKYKTRQRWKLNLAHCQWITNIRLQSMCECVHFHCQAGRCDLIVGTMPSWMVVAPCFTVKQTQFWDNRYGLLDLKQSINQSINSEAPTLTNWSLVTDPSVYTTGSRSLLFSPQREAWYICMRSWNWY